MHQKISLTATLSLFACVQLVPPAPAAVSNAPTPAAVAVPLPSGEARLTLDKAWGRLPHSSAPWILQGDKLPAPETRTGPGWTEVRIGGPVEKDTHVELYRFTLDLSQTPSNADADASRTWLRHGKWQTAAALAGGESAAQKAWPVVPGMSSAWRKNTSVSGLAEHDGWSGFSGEQFKGMGGTLRTVDRSAIARVNADGTVIGLTANRALAVGLDGASHLTLTACARDLKAGDTRDIRVRVWTGKGEVETLAEQWAGAMDTARIRLVFVGDSVGAARGSYTAILAGRINKEFGPAVRCLNASHGGDTTAIALKEYQPNVLDYSPNLVVIQLCYNDVGRIKPAEVAANLRRMIDPILAVTGGRVVLLTPLSYDKKRVDDMQAKGTDINKVHTADYIPELLKLTAEYGMNRANAGRVALVDIWQAMAAVREVKGADHVLLPDGSHPNEEGYAVIAEAAWPILKRQIQAALAVLPPTADPAAAGVKAP